MACQHKKIYTLLFYCLQRAIFHYISYSLGTAVVSDRHFWSVKQTQEHFVPQYSVSLSEKFPDDSTAL